MRLIGTGEAPNGQYPEGIVFDAPSDASGTLLDEGQFLLERGWARIPDIAELPEADVVRVANAVVRGDPLTMPLDQAIAASIAGREHAIVHAQDPNAGGGEPGELEPFPGPKAAAVADAGRGGPPEEGHAHLSSGAPASSGVVAAADAPKGEPTPEAAAVEVPVAEAAQEQPSEAEGAEEGAEDELEGEALQERARELGIEGRSKMSADELRQAVRDAEAEQS